MTEFLNANDAEGAGYFPVGSIPVSEAGLTQLNEVMRKDPRSLSHWLHGLHDGVEVGNFSEAVTTSNFPLLFGVLVQNDMLAKYGISVADWRAYCATGTMPNFNIATKHKVYGQDDQLPEVAQKGEYLVNESGTGHYHGQLKKYGRQFDISWEAIINDAMGAFDDIAARFANAVIRTEARHVTQLISDGTGPHVGLFGLPITDVDGQAVTNQGVLPLTIGNLETTMALMAAQTDPNGEPIAVRGVHLVVPTTLEYTARAILTSALMLSTAAAPIPATNIVPQLGLNLHVDPYLMVVDTAATNDTTWYLFAEPSQGKAIEMDYLSGRQAPEICMKASDKVAIGGGPMDPFSGDFATDNVFYRVRCVHGGWRLDPRYCYAQVGP